MSVTNDVPTGSAVHDAARVLRSLAAVFLVLAIVNAVLAVRDTVSWPLILTVGFTALALHLERRLAQQVSVDVAGRTHKTKENSL
jgi:hypothetical protein